MSEKRSFERKHTATCIRFFISVTLLIILSILSGCSSKNIDEDGIPVDFTVVASIDIPDDLKKIIKERRENAFELSYNDGEYLYIVKGYGKQDTSGYNVVVNSFTLADDSLVMDTELYGPKTDSKVSKKTTYPYIVIKTEHMSNSIIFK